MSSSVTCVCGFIAPSTSRSCPNCGRSLSGSPPSSATVVRSIPALTPSSSRVPPTPQGTSVSPVSPVPPTSATPPVRTRQRYRPSLLARIISFTCPGLIAEQVIGEVVYDPQTLTVDRRPDWSVWVALAFAFVALFLFFAVLLLFYIAFVLAILLLFKIPIPLPRGNIFAPFFSRQRRNLTVHIIRVRTASGAVRMARIEGDISGSMPRMGDQIDLRGYDRGGTLIVTGGTIRGHGVVAVPADIGVPRRYLRLWISRPLALLSLAVFVLYLIAVIGPH